MTRLAFGGKSSGFTTPCDWKCAAFVAATSRGPSSDCKAMTPSPAAPRPRKVLRLKSRTSNSSMPSVPRNEFVHVEHRPRHRGERGHANGIDVRRQRRLALAEELAGAPGVLCESFQVALVQSAQNRSLLRCGRASQRAIEH